MAKLLKTFGPSQKGKQYDVSKYEVICPDEVYMSDLHTLHKLHKHMSVHQEIQYIPTSDSMQLEAIGDEQDYNGEAKKYNNIKDIVQYKVNAINWMFPNQINLKEWKRGNK